MTRWFQAGLMVVLAAVGFAMVGCGDDLYGECSIEADSGSALEDCADEGDSDDVSCIVDKLECETGSCGRYRGSSPFCTVECSDSGECPSGECREFVMRSGQQYCVANENLE